MAFDPLTAILDIGGKVLDRVIPDPEQRDAAKLELFKAQQAGEFKAMDQAFELAQSQIEVNKVEAASSSLFVAGWRPTIGYICAFGLAYNFTIYPTLGWYAARYMPGFTPPPLLSDNLMELVMGMLGLAGLRTMEKIKIGG